MDRSGLGQLGEQVAADYLAAHGAQIVARNWRAKKSVHGLAGELDLVVMIGPVVVAVEVKTRAGLGYGHPLEAITAIKLRRLHQLLVAWASENRQLNRTRRVDAVAVLLQRRPGKPTAVTVEHRPGLT
ncbi:YraN family protein [Kocuria sp.]|uniref:YraN family protein n=1 Tax=Kocuria sp. TaxID=1871328 RepID=UPI0026DF309D|nr:YraN family protein [Kocuria sp.]MDO5618286.1 YraN family protein [Kocuria sp.]